MTAQLILFAPPSQRNQPNDFEVWWSGYPHKVCKGQARRAWAKARQQATMAELLSGVERYKAAKPADIPWCNPATWLNGERWLDAPSPTGYGVTSQPATSCRTTQSGDAELHARARTIAAGLPCPGVTFRQLARMVELGLVTREQIARY